MVADIAKQASAAAARLNASVGIDGIEDLRRLYPNSYFYRIDKLGIMVLWRGNPLGFDSTRIPNGLSFHSGYIQDLRTGCVLKNKLFSGDLPEEFFPDEAKVAIVMES